MKTFRKYLAAVAALIMILSACGIAAAEQEVRRMETAADADEWISAFLGEHPEELEGAWAMTAQMEAAVSQLGGVAGFAKQMAALGAVAEISPAYEGEIQGFKTFSVPCVFSAMSVDLILIVQDGAIAGLQTGAYSGGQKEEPEASGAFDSIAPASGGRSRASRTA